jgi:hypothetical protein
MDAAGEFRRHGGNSIPERDGVKTILINSLTHYQYSDIINTLTHYQYSRPSKARARLRPTRDRDPERKELAQREIAYLTTHRERARYGYFRERGYRIGSGVIEAWRKAVIRGAAQAIGHVPVRVRR